MLAEQQQDRESLIQRFLADSGFESVSRDPLKGDASFRRYERLSKEGITYMLMDAPPPQEDVRPFIKVTHLLHAYGLSAPRIVAQDEGNGFLILEDLGNDLYSAILKAHPERELELYKPAVGVLVELFHEDKLHTTATKLPPYDREVCLREVCLVTDWFMPQMVGLEKAAELKASYIEAWNKAFDATPCDKPVPVLRDYHADNLMWLPERDGLARVGQLDYQDALLGDPAYDLASFLEDIRRDVAPDTIAELLNWYRQETGQTDEAFTARYAVQAALRNAKIVGIFTRLCVRDGKPHYLNWLPAVWRWLEHDLEHEVLNDVRGWFDAHVKKEWRGVYEADASIGSLA